MQKKLTFMAVDRGGGGGGDGGAGGHKGDGGEGQKLPCVLCG